MNGRKAKKQRKKAESMYNAIYGNVRKPNKLWVFVKRYIIGMRVFNKIPRFRWFYNCYKRVL